MNGDGRSAGSGLAVPRRVEEARRLVVIAPFLAALSAASLGDGQRMFEFASGGILGYLLAMGLELLWRERTRPKAKPIWVLLGLAWTIAVVVFAFAPPLEQVAFYQALIIVGGIGLVFRHDNGLTPSLFLAAAVIVAVMQPGLGERRFEEGEATWIAIAVLLGIVAATLEHERLMRREGAGTAGAWTVIRMAFVGVWTIVILSLREEVQWGRVFTLFGADLRGQAGQMLLIGIILVSLVVAAFAFKPAKRGQRPG